MIYNDINFIRRYAKIPCTTKNFHKYEWGSSYWSAKELAGTLKSDIEIMEITDFIWFAFNFSLISETIYFFSSLNYYYCKNYVNWLYKEYLGFSMFGKVFIGKLKLKELVDIRHLVTNRKFSFPEELFIKFEEHSCKMLDYYTAEFLNSIICLDNKACCQKLKYREFLRKIIIHEAFLKEFGQDKDSLSSKYYLLLSDKIMAFNHKL